MTFKYLISFSNRRGFLFSCSIWVRYDIQCIQMLIFKLHLLPCHLHCYFLNYLVSQSDDICWHWLLFTKKSFPNVVPDPMKYHFKIFFTLIIWFLRKIIHELTHTHTHTHTQICTVFIFKSIRCNFQLTSVRQLMCFP